MPKVRELTQEELDLVKLCRDRYVEALNSLQKIRQEHSTADDEFAIASEKFNETLQEIAKNEVVPDRAHTVELSKCGKYLVIPDRWAIGE